MGCWLECRWLFCHWFNNNGDDEDEFDDVDADEDVEDDEDDAVLAHGTPVIFEFVLGVEDACGSKVGVINWLTEPVV